MEKVYSDIYVRLSRSKFRSSFHLSNNDLNIIKEKGMDKIKKDVREILEKRIKKRLKNDGRQTPWKGYPCFTSQHATATCCRKCIEKWYKIPKEKELNDKEMEFFVDLIIFWIRKECNGC